jgi:uncharacterized protein (DUF697 family)
MPSQQRQVSLAASGVEPVRQVQGHVMPDVTVLDRQTVNASVTNAALELLPESLASMAILPLQVRLVYQIGKAYGYELDQGHIKEFLATLGVGLAGQYIEQFGRNLLGGLLGTPCSAASAARSATRRRARAWRSRRRGHGDSSQSSTTVAVARSMPTSSRLRSRRCSSKVRA